MNADIVDELRAGEVEVRVVALGSRDEETIGQVETLLSATERARAQAFHFAQDRRDYVMAHALLRVTLARHCSADPRDLELTSDPTGRPGLFGGPPTLHFSLSHTEGLAAVAVVHAAAVGVDVEHLEPAEDRVELADRYFTADEARELRALPAERISRRFLELWTLKEAYAKACGVGLSLPLDHVGFTFSPGCPPCATFMGQTCENGAWQFALLRPTSRHVAAVARSCSWPLLPRLLTISPHELHAAARGRT